MCVCITLMLSVQECTAVHYSKCWIPLQRNKQSTPETIQQNRTLYSVYCELHDFLVSSGLSVSSVSPAWSQFTKHIRGYEPYQHIRSLLYAFSFKWTFSIDHAAFFQREGTPCLCFLKSWILADINYVFMASDLLSVWYLWCPLEVLDLSSHFSKASMPAH